MAIPFRMPAEDDAERLQHRLEGIIMEYYEVLHQAGLLSPADANQRAVLTPVGADVRTTPLPSMLSGRKTCASTSQTLNHTTNATSRLSWQQLGAELREIADSYSDKHSQSSDLLPCSNVAKRYPNGKSSRKTNNLCYHLLSFFLPESWIYSATVIYVGIRLLKRGFA